MKLLLNGKFLGRPMTGVDRYALEIAACLSSQAAAGGDTLRIAVPPGAFLDDATLARLGNAQLVRSSFGRRAMLWEQIVLPFIARNRLLLSLCNIGPLVRQNQCLMIADGQFVTQGQSYSWAFRTWYRFALPVLARRAKYLITISEYSRVELERLDVFPKGKAQIVPCGVDHVRRIVPDDAIFQKIGIAPQGYLLVIGSRARHKNVVPMLQALRAKLPQGARIVVAGGGNSKVFADDGLVANDDIVLAGRVSDEELVALYSHARAFLFPSLTEGFGLPPAEAMALGCPVIASDRGAIPEVMGDACLYADPSDWQGWIEAINRLWDDADLRADLVARGYKRADLWTWDKAAEKLKAAIGIV